MYTANVRSGHEKLLLLASLVSKMEVLEGLQTEAHANPRRQRFVDHMEAVVERTRLQCVELGLGEDLALL